jgi:hypothetical protein
MAFEAIRKPFKILWCKGEGIFLKLQIFLRDLGLVIGD